MNWTSEYPTQPGFYWIRNCKLSRWRNTISKPIIVRLNAKLHFYHPDDAHPYFPSDVLSAEWFGPIAPPEPQTLEP
jgi:hypothetical protein